MKTVTIISLFYLFTSINAHSSRLDNVKISLPKGWVADLEGALKESKLKSDKEVSARVNEFVDKLFTKLQTKIKEYNGGIIELENITTKIPTGHLDLWSGQLQDLDTISRRDDVDIVYNHEDRKLKMVLPIRFELLKFLYYFHAKVTFIGVHGHMDGTAEHIHINLEFSFDFKEMTASLDHYDMKHSGSLSSAIRANNFCDKLAENLGTHIRNFGQDNVTLTNAKLTVNEALVVLTNGILSGRSVIHRDGTCDFAFEKNHIMEADLLLVFDEIKIQYHTDVQIALVTVPDELTMTVKNVRIRIQISYNFDQVKTTLEKFDLRSMGRATVRFEKNLIGEPLITDIKNALTTVASQIVTRDMDALEEKLKEFIVMADDTINGPDKPAVSSG